MEFPPAINYNHQLTGNEVCFFIYSAAAFSTHKIDIKLLTDNNHYYQLNISWDVTEKISVTGRLPTAIANILTTILMLKRIDKSVKKYYTSSMDDCATGIIGLAFKEQQENIFIDFPLSEIKTKFETETELLIYQLLININNWAREMIEFLLKKTL